MKHSWTRPVWKDGRLWVGRDGNGDMAVWKMHGQVGDENAHYENVSAEYDTREEMGR